MDFLLAVTSPVHHPMLNTSIREEREREHLMVHKANRILTPDKLILQMIFPI